VLEFLLTFSLRRASVSSEKAVTANRKSVKERLLEIGKMPKPELVRLWREFYGTAPPKQGRRDLLVRFVAYRFQEQTLGGLSHKTKNRLLQLARRIEKDPKTDLIGAPQIKPGTCLVRDWRGKPHRVLVLVGGYEYAGKKYASLSEIARHITGTRWSGPLFFGLKTAKRKE
jgi:hypothetical protein